MASPRTQHCANYIGTLLFPILVTSENRKSTITAKDTTGSI